MRVAIVGHEKPLLAALTAGCLVCLLCGIRCTKDKPFVETETDDADMVTIPGGRFRIGSEEGGFDEEPMHEVSLGDFRMSVHEVTCTEYRDFIINNPSWRKGNVPIELAHPDYLLDWEGEDYPAGLGKHPVVFVSWYAARAYVRWLGKGLPTEAQWEFAARGGASQAVYPWGNEFRPHLARWGDSLQRGAVRVGSFTRNGFGLFDMAGNVAEWTADGYGLYSDRAETDPHPRINRHLKVVRGGSWKNDEDELRVSSRARVAPTACLPDLGFRLVSTGP